MSICLPSVLSTHTIPLNIILTIIHKWPKKATLINLIGKANSLIIFRLNLLTDTTKPETLTSTDNLISFYYWSSHFLQLIRRCFLIMPLHSQILPSLTRLLKKSTICQIIHNMLIWQFMNNTLIYAYFYLNYFLIFHPPSVFSSFICRMLNLCLYVSTFVNINTNIFHWYLLYFIDQISQLKKWL